MSYQAQQYVLKTESDPTKSFEFDNCAPNATFELITKTLSEADLTDGEILVKTLYLSNDPAQKFWIASVDKNYSAGAQIGELIPARGLGVVLASKSSKFSTGDYISGYTGWSTHCILKDDGKMLSKLDMTNVDELWWFLSVLGGTAMTSYFMLFEEAKLDPVKDQGLTYLITGAAGAVGTAAVQLALNVFGAAKVIAVAGGEDKKRFVESFGDKVIGVDYKSATFKEDLLKAAGPNSVDIMIDNVGGEILDFALFKLMKPLSTVLCCGSISGYNDTSSVVMKAAIMIMTKRLTLKGLLLGDHIKDFPVAQAKLREYIKNGQLDAKGSATIVDALGKDFVNVPKIWSGLFEGKNKGKYITRVGEL